MSVDRAELILISIHASEKEATVSSKILALTYRFQSTPPRRRRLDNVIMNPPYSIFQSTPPRRRRRTDQAALGRALAISIHASEKEATGKITSSAGLRTISIHASEKEATPDRRQIYI